ncbi:metal-dependent hydrolase [Longirhabdus pacifica]|uniref:metal-dependent hydrolase n=1 Tax=Longirhabdus pacifica TaxID=2305227 RepID=UPI001008A61F|nr:metal-dependent hydrolase [Longirhabdus pacifica]
MKITYLGHSCLLIEGSKKKVIIDPFISENSNCSVNYKDIEVDAVLLTHAHADHFGDSLHIAKQNDCPIFAVYELAAYCSSQGAKVVEMNVGGTFKEDGIFIRYTQAFHSSSLFVDGQFVYMGQPCGIVLEMDGKTLYHAGDTSLFSDMKMIGDLHPIDVAALPIGDVYTMGPEDALIAAEWLHAKQVIPVHYNTFPPITQDAGKFARDLKEKDITGLPLQIGDVMQI